MAEIDNNIPLMTLGSLNESVKGLNRAIDSLLTEMKSDHDHLVSLGEQVKQIFIDLRKLTTRISEMVPTVEQVLEQERARARAAQDEADFRRDMRAATVALGERIGKLETAKEAVKTGGITFVKGLLLAVGGGAGGSVIWPVVDWLRRVFA